LDVNPMVREIYIDNQFLQNTQKKISAVNISLFLFLFLSIGVYYQITTILRGVVIRDYMVNSIKTPQNKKNFMFARNKNLIPFLGSSLIGGLLFFNVYIILKEKYQQIFSTLILQSFKQLLMLEIIATIIVIILAWKSTSKLKKDEV
ncbi:MAG: hypothetical protein ACRCYT_08105, partial [Cetobacterium sp.]